MDIDTTLTWLTVIAVVSGIGFVLLLALSHGQSAAQGDEEGTRF